MKDDNAQQALENGNRFEEDQEVKETSVPVQSPETFSDSLDAGGTVTPLSGLDAPSDANGEWTEGLSPEEAVVFRCYATRQDGLPCEAGPHHKLAHRCSLGHVQTGNLIARKQEPLEEPVELKPRTALETAKDQVTRLEERVMSLLRARRRAGITVKQRTELEQLLTKTEEQLLAAQANVARLMKENEGAAKVAREKGRHFPDLMREEWLRAMFAWAKVCEDEKRPYSPVPDDVIEQAIEAEVRRHVRLELERRELWAHRVAHGLDIPEALKLRSLDGDRSPMPEAEAEVPAVGELPTPPRGPRVSLTASAPSSPDRGLPARPPASGDLGVPYQVVNGTKHELGPNDEPRHGYPIYNVRDDRYRNRFPLGHGPAL